MINGKTCFAFNKSDNIFSFSFTIIDVYVLGNKTKNRILQTIETNPASRAQLRNATICRGRPPKLCW